MAALTTKYGSIYYGLPVFTHQQGISQGQGCAHPPDFMTSLQSG